jgi:DNA-binding response OmpR family regulator/two-component sensor histidine kinase
MVMILNPIEKLIKNEEDPEKRHALSTIKRNSTRILHLMNDFLDIRKLDNGMMLPEYKNVNLVQSIQDTLSNFSFEAEKRNIDLVFEYAFENMTFNVDPVHIDTIIFNLVSNALKYTPDGGEITIGLRMSHQYGNIEISVSDTGAGIDEKEIGLVFNRFYQTSTKQFTDPRGFGIGLNLCQMLAELHNGSIVVQNRLDRSGTVFTLTLPTMTETFESGEAGTNSVNVTEHQEKLKQKKTRVKNTERILIIEDDEETRLYLEEMLSTSYKIMTAKEGDSGLQRALTELPDLVLTDIVMPGANGLQILKRIKNNPNTTHIPVILLTSNTGMEDRLEGLEHGADGYIVKPFNIDELMTTIDNILKNRQRIRGKFSGAHQEDKIKPIEVKGNSDKLMERIMVVINDHLDDPDLRVEMLSEEVGLSRAQLHRRMKEITGISTGEFIRNIRLKKAAELLTEKKVNISQVAYMVGFSSQTHFSTAFRKFYGISPTEFMNRETEQ